MTFPTFQLSPEQEAACAGILTAMYSRDRGSVITLCGYAGTGKTTLLGELVRRIGGDRVVVSAPTHKALQQLKMSVGETKAAKTMQSLLCMRRIKDGQGDYIYEKTKTPAQIQQDFYWLTGRVLIVDEASMISEEDANMLIEVYAGMCKAIIFAGDLRQLPPVKAAQTKLMAPSVEGTGACARFSLETVVRHGGPILQLATALRSVPHGIVPFGRYGAAGVEIISDEPRWLAKWMETGGHGSKALAYTRKRVAELNQQMLTRIYGVGNADAFHLGQLLVTEESVSERSSKTPLFPSTTEIQICDLEWSAVMIGEDMSVAMPVVRMVVEAVETGVRGDLLVVPKVGMVQHEGEIRRLATAARIDRSKWPQFYRFKEMFTPLQPAYAMTVHKSQGSTYRDVFLDISDICSCSRGDQKQMNRLAYVGVTRAQRSLSILV